METASEQERYKIEALLSAGKNTTEKEVAQGILDGSIGGGHIISSSNSIHKGISSVNYQAFQTRSKSSENIRLTKKT